MTLLVILDTNIPILLSEGKFNLEKEITRLIPQKHTIVFLSTCLNELELISKKGEKIAKKVLFAKKFLQHIQLIDFDPEDIKTVDAKIHKFALENKGNCVIVTNDIELKNILLDNNIPVIFIRSKKHLEIIGSII